MKVLHYLNQFFAQIGGEDKAGQEVLLIPGAVGAGAVIENTLKDHGVEYATLACGDNYFHEQEEKALSAIRDALEQFSTRLLSCRSGLQRRSIRAGLRQGVQLGAGQLAHTGDHRHA